MPYLPKPKNNGKRTSLVPTWMNKKNRSKANQLQEESSLDDNIQVYEKVTYKNTTTRSIERVSPDGEYNKAIETNEQVEERIKFGNTQNIYDTPKDNIVDNKSSNYRNSLQLVRKDGMLLRDIQNQTKEICLEAVKQNGLALKYVKYQNELICLTAINQNHLAFSYVKDKNENLCNEVVKVNGLALELIKNQTPQICKNAIRQNPFSLQFVINQTDELCQEALYKSGLALEYVKNKTKELCLLALDQSSLAIRYIPVSLLSESLDLSNYVFVCVNSRSLVPSIPEIRGLKRINLSTNDTGYNIMNTLKYNDIPTNFVVQKEGYVDDNFVKDLKSRNHFVVVVVGPNTTI